MNDLEKAKILFTALFKRKSDSSPNYKIVELYPIYRKYFIFLRI